MNVLLTGASGLVGKEIGKKLVLAGHEVYVISRRRINAVNECPFPCRIIEGDLANEEIKDENLRKIQAVIHLAGESIAESRWSSEKKKRIYDSRVKGTQNLINSLKYYEAPVQVFVSTSASGYYGDQGDKILIESSIRGTGFLSEVCRDWERPIEVAEARSIFPQCRFLILRVGMVISPFGGALLKMILPFRLGLGGVLADGKQWMGWIHIEDLSNLYLKALESEDYKGIINAVAPQTLTNFEFSKTLAESFGKKLGPRVPKIALKLLLGEMSNVLLNSQRIESQRLHRLKFVYQYPTLKSAFAQACGFYKNFQEVFFAQQYLPFKNEDVFSFFSSAKNLEKLTPAFLNFKLMKMSSENLQAGTLIDYKLKIRGFPVNWRTEILHWNPPQGFSDHQLKGPYSRWVHSHLFQSLGPGTVMTDLVQYKLPLGVLGWVMAGLFVKKDVKKIFKFRKQVCAGMKF